MFFKFTFLLILLLKKLNVFLLYFEEIKYEFFEFLFYFYKNINKL